MDRLGKNNTFVRHGYFGMKTLLLRIFSYKLRVNYHNALVKTKQVNKLNSEPHKESYDFAA